MSISPSFPSLNRPFAFAIRRRTGIAAVCFSLLFNVRLSAADPRLVPVALGWAENSINAVIFRRGSVTSFRDIQVTAFYDRAGSVILARRKLDSTNWEIKKTSFRGNPADAHNSISIMFDGAGFLHLSWDQHNTPLHYARSVTSMSLDLSGALAMSHQREEMVTYPEFYRLPNGNLIFAYRDGSSGCGDLVLKRFDVLTQKWTQLQNNLISGQGQRSPYWQLAADDRGTIHVSWVWRESPDVASNHDLCYAKSKDGGLTWVHSDGSPYRLPITAATAEYAQRIPQGHELMNSTSMCADVQGHPIIATYWRPQDKPVPQYMVVFHDGEGWKVSQVSGRAKAFALSGGGTKRVPMSRPQIVSQTESGRTRCFLVFRDSERGSRISVAACDNLGWEDWSIRDLTKDAVGMWEPSFDAEQWVRSQALHLFVQRVGQGDGEVCEALQPQQISILEWTPAPTSKLVGFWNPGASH
jgi:hypothetical protein